MMTQKLGRNFCLAEFFWQAYQCVYSTSKYHVSYAIKETTQTGSVLNMGKKADGNSFTFLFIY